MTTRNRRPAGILLGLVLLGAGCSDPAQQEGTVSPEEHLRARPTFEQASRDYLTMLAAMRTAISQIVPAVRWTGAPQLATRSGCEAPFSDLPGAVSADFDAGTGEGGIPDQDWPRVVQALAPIAARYGFVTQETVAAEARNHYLSFHDGRNGTVEIGSEVNTTITVFSPCFLTQAAHGSTSSAPAG